MTFQAIYAQLLDGKKVTLAFKDPEEAESFRVKMSKYKKAEEDVAAVVDLKMGSENKIFSFQALGIDKAMMLELDVLNSTDVYRVVSFSERRPETHYHILAIE